MIGVEKGTFVGVGVAGIVAVGVGVAVRKEGVGVGEGVTGTSSKSPGIRDLPCSKGFASASASMVMPWRAAINHQLSPDFTS